LKTSPRAAALPGASADDVAARAARVRLLTCDVDGVLTDGRIYVDDDGREFKAFSALDGVGLNLLARGNVTVAWITGSAAPAVAHRARQLHVEYVILDASDKLTAWNALRAHRRRPARHPRARGVWPGGDGAARPAGSARARAPRHHARRRPRRGARARGAVAGCAGAPRGADVAARGGNAFVSGSAARARTQRRGHAPVRAPRRMFGEPEAPAPV